VINRVPPPRRVVLVVMLVLVSALAAWLTTPRRQAGRANADASGPLVLALAGDAAVSAPLDLAEPGLRAVSAVLGSASLGIVNFELSAPAGSLPPDPDTSGWPAATPEAAAQLRRLGVGAVSLANNHAYDFGAEGLRQVQSRLEAAGVAHAGAGENLDAARRAAVRETANGAVALVSVTLSHSAGARATARKGDINGRPGVNAVRFSRRLTVDAAAFAALTTVFPPAVLKANPGGRTWDLFGVTVERGTQHGMALVPEPEDLDGLSAAVGEARRRATTVIVSVHAHEPGNRVDEVPELLRVVARAAVDAGADVVSGHGPHRLRGIEMYHGRPIFYSLGNFVFPDRAIPPKAADQFEDMATNVLSPFDSDAPPEADFSEDIWRESVIALVRFDAGRVRRVELHPIDLGVGKDRATRGTPAPAAPTVGARILARLQALSAPFGTTIALENGIGVVKD